MKILLATALLLAITLWFFGPFMVWAAIVTISGVVAFIGFWWIIGEGR